MQLEEEGKCQSKPRLDFDHTLLNPWKAILEWRQSNCKCNISYCTFTFVQLDSIHCVLMILEVSPEAGWKWKIFTESSVIMLGEIIWFWLNIMWWLKETICLVFFESALTQTYFIRMKSLYDCVFIKSLFPYLDLIFPYVFMST